MMDTQNHATRNEPDIDRAVSQWVVHVTGADDVYPQPDELTALREANAINKLIAQREHREFDPICYALAKDMSREKA